MHQPPKPAAKGITSTPQRNNDLARVAELARTGKLHEAVAITERYLRTGTSDPDFLRYRAVLEKHLGNMSAALRWAAAAEAVFSHPDTLLILARADMRAGNTDQALERCRRILHMSPGNAQARLLLAETFESAVRVDEAAAALEDLRTNPQGVDASIAERAEHLRASVLVHRAQHAEAIELLDRTVLASSTNEPLVRRAWYLRAKACDRMQRYGDAFESATRANAIRPVPYDPAQYEQAVSDLMGVWTRDAMRQFPTSDSASEVPVFIAGMPRSGTSLIDQIVDAHAQAGGVGETKGIEAFAKQLEQAWKPDLPAPDCFGTMRDGAFQAAAQSYLAMCGTLAPGAMRVVNKALSNNRMIGVIARLFPRSRIIHALRDPRDVAVSCFMGGFNNATYPWTTRIDWIAAAWAQSERLMQHWKRETDLPILDVRYEDVVTNPDTEFPRFIQFLGLPWDEGCTRFHESRRTVRTLSYDQVNRPLYATSVNRWQHYEKFLQGVVWPKYG